MKETDKQELTKKLAEFVWGKDNLQSYQDGRFLYYQTTYNERDEEWNIEIVPDFSEDFNACLEWLLPQVRFKFGVSKIDFCYVGDEVGCRLYGGYGAVLELSKGGLSETESLALCLAIEKLIDG